MTRKNDSLKFYEGELLPVDHSQVILRLEQVLGINLYSFSKNLRKCSSQKSASPLFPSLLSSKIMALAKNTLIIDMMNFSLMLTVEFLLLNEGNILIPSQFLKTVIGKCITL